MGAPVSAAPPATGGGPIGAIGLFLFDHAPRFVHELRR
jgi:hypothetical protein